MMSGVRSIMNGSSKNKWCERQLTSSTNNGDNYEKTLKNKVSENKTNKINGNSKKTQFMSKWTGEKSNKYSLSDKYFQKKPDYKSCDYSSDFQEKTFNKPIIIRNKFKHNKKITKNEFVIDIEKESFKIPKKIKTINDSWPKSDEEDLFFGQPNPMNFHLMFPKSKSTMTLQEIKEINSKFDIYMNTMICEEDLDIALEFYRSTKLTLSEFAIKYSIDRFIDMNDLKKRRYEDKLNKNLKSIAKLENKKNKGEKLNKNEIIKLEKKILFEFEKKQMKYYYKYIMCDSSE